MQVLLGYVLDPEHAGECQVEREQRYPFDFGLTFELERHLEIGWCELAHPDVDLDVDRGLRFLWRERPRRIRVLEREILDVLAEDTEPGPGLRLRLRLRAAIGRCHET